jgi:hypothetical protein
MQDIVNHRQAEGSPARVLGDLMRQGGFANPDAPEGEDAGGAGDGGGEATGNGANDSSTRYDNDFP